MDEYETGTTALEEYLEHSLLGYMVGLIIYCLYLIVACVQSSMDHGMLMVWGVRMTEVVSLGLLGPLVCAIAGVLQAAIAPLPYLRSYSRPTFLIIGALVLSAMTYWLIPAVGTTVEFTMPRAQHP